MIDGDDVGDFAVFFFPTSLPGFVAWLLILGVLAMFWFHNEKECASQTCPQGQYAELLEGKCVCVGQVLAE